MSDSVHLVCPKCNAVNRVPETRLAHRPKCGQCREELFAGQPVNLTAENFSKHISRNEIPVLVDFWAPWCGPCRMMAPWFVQAASVLEPNVRLAKVDTQAEQTIGAQFAIQSIPTLALFRGGREVARQAGAMRAQDIVQWARTH